MACRTGDYLVFIVAGQAGFTSGAKEQIRGRTVPEIILRQEFNSIAGPR